MNPAVVNATNNVAAVQSSLVGLTSHPGHTYLDVTPSLLEGAFGEITSHLTGYRQVTDATLLHVAAHHGASLATFDKGVAVLAGATVQVDLLHG